MAGERPHSFRARATQPNEQVSAMESFVRLQESQVAFLQWLEASERQPHVDRYFYKKIR